MWIKLSWIPLKLWGWKLQPIHWCWEGRNNYEDEKLKNKEIMTNKHEKSLPHYESV